MINACTFVDVSHPELLVPVFRNGPDPEAVCCLIYSGVAGISTHRAEVSERLGKVAGSSPEKDGFMTCPACIAAELAQVEVREMTRATEKRVVAAVLAVSLQRDESAEKSGRKIRQKTLQEAADVSRDAGAGTVTGCRRSGSAVCESRRVVCVAVRGKNDAKSGRAIVMRFLVAAPSYGETAVARG